MSKGFGGYAEALEFRELVDQMVKESLAQNRPAPTYAEVHTIDAPNRLCMVVMTGDTTPVLARCASILPSAVGQIVRIEGPPGARYIADVLGNNSADAAVALKANIASPAFTGNPSSAAAPTLGAHLVNKTYADTKAPTASPTFTGTPTVSGGGHFSSSANPTADTHLARKAYVDLPIVVIRRSTAISIPNNSFTTVPMNVIEADARATGLSSQSDGFGAVIRETGFYRIDASVRMAHNVNGVRLLSIDISGFNNVGADHRVPMPFPDETMLHAGFARYLTSGTTVRALVYQNSGGNLNAMQNHCQMSVFCVRR